MRPSFINSPHSSKEVSSTQGVSSLETSSFSLFPVLAIGNTDETPNTQTTFFSLEGIFNKFHYTNINDKLIRIFPTKQSVGNPSRAQAECKTQLLSKEIQTKEAHAKEVHAKEVPVKDSALYKQSDKLSEPLMLQSLLFKIFKEDFYFSEQALFTMYKEGHPAKERYLAFALSALQASKLCWKMKTRINYLIYLSHEESCNTSRVKMTKNSLNTELKELFIYFFHYYELLTELQQQEIKEEINISAKEMNKINKDPITQIRTLQKQIKDIKRYYNQTSNERQVTEKQLIQNIPLHFAAEELIQTIKSNFTSLSNNEIIQIIKIVTISIAKSQVYSRYMSTLAKDFWDLLTVNTVNKSDFYMRFQQFFFSSWKTDSLLSKQAKIDLTTAKKANDYQTQCVITNAQNFRKDLKKQAAYLFFLMLKLVQARINLQNKKEQKFRTELNYSLNTINEAYKNLYLLVYLPYIARSKQQWTVSNPKQLAIKGEIITLTDLQKKSETINSRLYALNYKNLVSHTSSKQLEFIDRMMAQLHQKGQVSLEIFETFFKEYALSDTSTSFSSIHSLNPKQHSCTPSPAKKSRKQKTQASTSVSQVINAVSQSTSAGVLKFSSETAEQSKLNQNSTSIHFAHQVQVAEYKETEHTDTSLTAASFSSQFFEHEGLEEFLDILPSQPLEFEED